MLRGWSMSAATTTTTAATAPPSKSKTPSPVQTSLFAQHIQQETPERVRTLLLEALKQKDPQHRNLKQLLREHFPQRRFPTQFRLQLWCTLLDYSPQPETDAKLCKAIRSCEMNLANQRVIVVDVERTRADLPDFRKPETQRFATQLLTYFCKSRNAKYKQGLNEMLAPFVYLYLQSKTTAITTTNEEVEHPEALVYRLFVTFLDRFLPHLYADDMQPGQKNEMITLQCSFRFYELLLQYHDPELWQLLDHNKLKPELYSSSWFMTMFAQAMPISLCYELWEQLLLGDSSLSGDYLLIPFLAVAYVCTNRLAFLNCDASDLPVQLTSKLSYHRKRRSNSSNNALVLLSDVLWPTIAVAGELRKHTPDVLLWEMRNTLQVLGKPPVAEDLAQLSTRFCATCSPEFLWMGLTGRLEDSTEMIVIDCRPRREFAQQRIRARLVFNVDEEMLQCPEELEVSLREIKQSVDGGGGAQVSGPESLSKAWRWHICVVGVSGPSVNNPAMEFDDTTGMAILHLLKHTLPCVCVVEGGWQYVINRCPHPERLLTATAESSAVTPQRAIRQGSSSGGVLRSNVKGVRAAEEEEDYIDTGRSSVIVSRKSRGLPVNSEDIEQELVV